ncbi:MAG: pilin [Candidatus Altiarchaeia archaeon]
MNKKIYLLITIIFLACLALESTGQTPTWTPPPVELTSQMQEVLDQLVKFICWPACLIMYVSSGIASLLLIIAGARYIAADDPGTRSELRRFMTGVLAGLVIVLLSIPILNFILDGLLPEVACTCIDAPVENINTVFCNLITALSVMGPWLCALVVIYGGIRYLASADDPGARKAAKATLIAAFVGLLIVMLAIPLVNAVLGDVLKQVECETSENEFTDQVVAVLGNFLCILALIAPPICALVVTYGGLRYITSADDPGARDAAKTIIISALIGMILVMIAVPLVNVVLTSSFEQVSFDCSDGQITTEITRIMCAFICFLSYIAPAICALVVIYGGIRYLVSGDDPGARRTAKTIIISAFVGLVLVFISVPLVNTVLTGAFGQVGCDCSESQSVKDIVAILCKFICLIASIAPAIAALVMMYGGLRYVTSAEDPGARSAAKTTIISALAGLILVMISLAMVNVVVSGWAKGVQCGCFNVDPVEQINRVFCSLVCMIQMITPSVAALVIIYGGLRYVTSAEDPSARAAARSIIINAIIGLVFVMLSVQIINIVITGLVPTFKCDCVQLFPEIFGQLGAAGGGKTADNPDSGKIIACSSTADAAKLGPTWVYDATAKACINKCAAGQKCCQATDQSGHPGCIGTDTSNQVKLNSCSLDDYLTSYECVSDKCQAKTTDCGIAGCKDQYGCNGGTPDPKLHILSSDAICTDCCQVGTSECHYSYDAGGETQYGHNTGIKITKCDSLGSNGPYTVEWRESGTVGSLITINPVAGAKCASADAAPACSSTADAAKLGPTWVYDTVKKDCVNKCAAGERCCQATDQSGHPGCIGTDTVNQVKPFNCFDGQLSTYKCVSDKCTFEEELCATTCKDQYSCN